MFGIGTTAGGSSQAFPDVCKTPAPPAPPVPVPYPNMAELMQADSSTCSQKLTVGNKPALTTKSVIPMTSGDEAGAVGGVTSNKIKGEAQFLKGSLKLEIEGSPAVFQTCLVGHNGKPFNAPTGIHSAPSQTKVTVML